MKSLAVSGSPTSAGIITFDSGIFTVQGSHTYAEENVPGFPFAITVTIHHDSAPDATAMLMGVSCEGIDAIIAPDTTRDVLVRALRLCTRPPPPGGFRQGVLQV